MRCKLSLGFVRLFLLSAYMLTHCVSCADSDMFCYNERKQFEIEKPVCYEFCNSCYLGTCACPRNLSEYSDEICLTFTESPGCCNALLLVNAAKIDIDAACIVND
jgi:hypothetical protein